MTLFLVTHWKLELINKSNPKEGVRMVIVLKRKIMSEMLVTYFPSVLLMAITFATTFFKPFFFEAGLSVNLTTMLVMTTIFISVMEKLPLTSYPKMIDFWLIFCQVGKLFRSKSDLSQLVPFAEVVLLTAMEYCREGKFNGQHLHSKSNQIKPTYYKQTRTMRKETQGQR